MKSDSKMTFGQWIENYWYHYKWHTIIGLLLVFALTVSVTQCALQPDYDLTCILYCDRTVLDTTLGDLTGELQPLCEDYDQNGETLLEVYNVSYDSSNTTAGTAGYANTQKLMTLVSTADYMLYIVDEYGYQRLMNEDNMQLFETYDFLPDKDGTAWNWKGSKLQQSMSEHPLPENLYFCIRKIEGTPFADDQEAIAREKNAVSLIKQVMDQ